MTLRELAQNYNGSINIGVYGAETDETPEFVFPSNIHEKIKDEVMDREIACYTVKSNLLLNSQIHVVLAQETVIDQKPEGNE